MGVLLIQGHPHRDHLGEVETVLLEESLRFLAEFVGEQGNAFEIFLFRVIDHIIEHQVAEALGAVGGEEWGGSTHIAPVQLRGDVSECACSRRVTKAAACTSAGVALAAECKADGKFTVKAIDPLLEKICDRI